MPDDIRTLAQAVVDAGPTECIWPVNAPTSALLKALMPEVGDKASPLYDTARAILAALDAADAQGYAQAMGEVVEHLNSLSDAAVATYQEHRTDYADGFADGSVEAWQAVRKLAERD